MDLFDFMHVLYWEELLVVRRSSQNVCPRIVLYTDDLLWV